MSYNYNQTRKNERRIALLSKMDNEHLKDAVVNNKALRDTLVTYISKINENRNKKNQVTLGDILGYEV